MKISTLEKMTVSEIMDKLDLPNGFIEDFKKWCEEKRAELDKAFEEKGKKK